MVAADGAACDDGLACNESEVCTGGTCGGGAATDCDDGDPCTADSCAEPGGCENTPVAGCATDGGLPDGGVDAGDVVDDGGVDEDAGPEPDASTPTDATVPTDASELDASLDAAVTTPADDGGCSCAVPGTGPRTPIGGALLVLAAAALGLRRRRR
jgi:MYXO-CTERM domain-containing protein